MRSNQDLVHGAARQPQVLGERSYTPAAVVLRLLASAGLHPQHHFLAIFYRSTGTRGILETLQTLVGKNNGAICRRSLQASRARQRFADCSCRQRPPKQSDIAALDPAEWMVSQLKQLGLRSRVHRDGGSDSRHAPNYSSRLKYYNCRAAPCTRSWDVLACSYPSGDGSRSRQEPTEGIPAWAGNQ